MVNNMDKIIKFLALKKVYGILIIIALSIILYKIIDALINKILSTSKNPLDKKRKKTVVELLRNIIKYGIIILAVIFALDLYGVNVTSLVASIGVVSAISALALQDTLKDIIAGTTIIMDNFYMVGDYVTYDGFTGVITQLGLRTTKIRDFEGKTLVVSNRNINSIINLSQTEASEFIKISTAYEEKTEKVEKVLKEVVKKVKTWDTVNPEGTSYIGIMELSDSSVVYGIKISCSPGKRWEYKRKILKLVKETYEENHIKIPYPQIEVHNGKN